MRFYDITISSATTPPVLPSTQQRDLLTGVTTQSSSITQQSKVLRHYSSLLSNGLTDPSALTVEFDIPVVFFGDPFGNAHIKIWGVSITEIMQASNYNGQLISMQIGMMKGLPLANPQQAGMVLNGKIYQSYGNWQGTNQSIEFIVQLTGFENISSQWMAGTSLAQHIKSTIETTFTGYTADVSKMTDLIGTETDTYSYSTLTDFALHMKSLSQSLNKDPSYSGINIGLRGNEFFVNDGTTQETPKVIDFKDLIGQPTWIRLNAVQFSTVARSDIGLGDWIKLPQGIATLTKNSYSNLKQTTSFQGVFKVTSCRHVGNSRQADGNSWITVIEAIQ